MDKLNRLYKLHRLFRGRRHPIPLARIREELGCSERTARRLIAELRDELHAPIEYERERNGFYYAGAERDSLELPGLWFSADELYALRWSFAPGAKWRSMSGARRRHARPTPWTRLR